MPPSDENQPRRSATDQAPPKGHAPEAADELDDQHLEHDADTGPDVRTPEPDEPRQGEAGAEYTGRGMDDRLKTNPRPDSTREDEDDV